MLYHLVVALCVAAAAAKPGGDKLGGDAKAKCGELVRSPSPASTRPRRCPMLPQMTEAKDCFKECEKEGKGPRGPPPMEDDGKGPRGPPLMDKDPGGRRTARAGRRIQRAHRRGQDRSAAARGGSPPPEEPAHIHDEGAAR